MLGRAFRGDARVCVVVMLGVDAAAVLDRGRGELGCGWWEDGALYAQAGAAAAESVSAFTGGDGE